MWVDKHEYQLREYYRVILALSSAAWDKSEKIELLLREIANPGREWVFL